MIECFRFDKMNLTESRIILFNQRMRLLLDYGRLSRLISLIFTFSFHLSIVFVSNDMKQIIMFAIPWVGINFVFINSCVVHLMFGIYSYLFIIYYIILCYDDLIEKVCKMFYILILKLIYLNSLIKLSMHLNRKKSTNK